VWLNVPGAWGFISSSSFSHIHKAQQGARRRGFWMGYYIKKPIESKPSPKNHRIKTNYCWRWNFSNRAIIQRHLPFSMNKIQISRSKVVCSHEIKITMLFVGCSNSRKVRLFHIDFFVRSGGSIPPLYAMRGVTKSGASLVVPLPLLLSLCVLPSRRCGTTLLATYWNNQTAALALFCHQTTLRNFEFYSLKKRDNVGTMALLY